MPSHKALLCQPVDHAHGDAVVQAENSRPTLCYRRYNNAVRDELVDRDFAKRWNLRVNKVGKLVLCFRQEVRKYLLCGSIKRPLLKQLGELLLLLDRAHIFVRAATSIQLCL